jgi:hypothetical protein
MLFAPMRQRARRCSHTDFAPVVGSGMSDWMRGCKAKNQCIHLVALQWFKAAARIPAPADRRAVEFGCLFGPRDEGALLFDRQRVDPSATSKRPKQHHPVVAVRRGSTHFWGTRAAGASTHVPSDAPCAVPVHKRLLHPSRRSIFHDATFFTTKQTLWTGTFAESFRTQQTFDIQLLIRTERTHPKTNLAVEAL